MSEAFDLREVDEFIASMDATPVPVPDASTTSLLLPALADPPAASPAGATAAAPHAQETDREKPTPDSSTFQLPQLRSDRSSSPGNSVLPLTVGNHEPPPSTNTSSSPAPTSPRLTTAVVASTPSSEPLCDLDALSELLRSESQPLSTHHERRESFGDRASHTDSIGKSSALPPLLSSAHKSLSFAAPHGQSQSAGARRSTMLQKQASLALVGQPSPSKENGEETSPRLLYSPRSTTMLNKQTMSPSRRRLTIGTHEISHHALERLGVNTDILKKEKGMKKLGISDVDIERFEEIRRYSGVPHNQHPVTKVEFMFGFTREQLQRVKAINRLGTSEEEVQDEYSRRISRLGVHDVPIAQN